MFDSILVKPDQMYSLANVDADGDGVIGLEKEEAKKAFEKLNKKLESLQELMYAEGKRKLLVVLQGMDTSGKDSTIRQVFEHVNPQGVKVASFKVPTPQEMAHDYLWRIHQRTPGSGEIVIFNRSHYEDVLVVRVHNLVPEARWQKRFEHIREFEKMLTDEGTTILKFYLHIDKDEQKKRLQERLDTPEKHWKFNIGDLKERAIWDQYQKAYEEALARTSRPWAPWYVIPSNRKWVRNYYIASILVDTLEGFKMKFPPAEEGLDSVVIE